MCRFYEFEFDYCYWILLCVIIEMLGRLRPKNFTTSRIKTQARIQECRWTVEKRRWMVSRNFQAVSGRKMWMNGGEKKVVDRLGKWAYSNSQGRGTEKPNPTTAGTPRRKKVTMSETTITRKAALEFAIANLDNPEVCAVLQKMLGSISKPRKATISKARVMNENLANKVAELIADDHATAITTKDVVALGIPEIATTQKAAAVLRVAVERGLFEKVVDGKKVGYRKLQ